jgi:hypothetical protein
MKRACALVAAGACLLAPAVMTAAQEVYRCQQADGSTTFSDRPCDPGVGGVERVDATPHQGHRPAPAGPAYEPQTGRKGGAPATDRAPETRWDEVMPRRERLSLERRRKSLLSELRRRHLGEEERRAMIEDLRAVDRRLGLGAEDVPDMPPHDRDVYDANAIYPEE